MRYPQRTGDGHSLLAGLVIKQFQFESVCSAAVLGHNLAKTAAAFLRHEKEAMPVRTPIMMRLCHAKAIYLDFFTAQVRTNTRPNLV